MKIIIDISDKDLEILTFQPLKPLPKVNIKNLIQIIQQGILIPDNVTNGDLFRIAFPNYKISESENNILIEDDEGGKIYVNKEWFNKPYKEEYSEIVEEEY